MKINDLRKLSDKDLLSRLVDNKESLQKYRFQKSIQQLEDYKVLSDLRRENARINTILKNIRKKSLKNKIDPKITNRIWKNMIWSYIDFERRNFKKK